MGADKTGSSKLHAMQSSPITRFCDVVPWVCGVPVRKMVWRFYEEQAGEQAARRERQRRTVETVEQWEAERARFRVAYEDALGPAPALEVEVEHKGSFEKHGILFKKLLFTSFDGNWVPAVFSMPADAGGPLPAVISACGHSTAGKAGYAHRSVLLARNGYAGLCFDLPGQGERSLPGETARRYPASTQHNILGCKLTLAGGNLARVFVQDTSAAVTVLQRMAEVDGGRVGITGSSGGGWLSIHAAALDERIRVVVPAASVRSMREHVDAADAEQAFWRLQRRGIDFPDLLSFLICPRPVLIVANSQDIWPVSTTEYAFDEARRFYDLFACGDRIGMKTWERGHEYRLDQFGEAIHWFNRFLKDDPDAPVAEAGDIGAEIAPDELLVCDGGTVCDMGVSLPSQAYWRILKSRSCRRKNLDGFLDYLQRAVAVPETVDWAEMDRFDFGSGAGRRICYQPEEGILLPAEILFPREAEDVVILVDEDERRGDLHWQLDAANAGSVVIRPDLRGWGETAGEEEYSDWEGWAINRFASRRYRLHALALITGRSVALDRVRDLLALLPIAAELAPGRSVRVHGRRGGAWIALLAGVAARRIDALVLEGGLASFRDVMECAMPLAFPDIYVPNLLTWGVDVSDLIHAFAGTATVRDARGADLRPLRNP